MKVVQLARSVGGATALLALVGCASTRYEGKYEWSEGWREAEVIAVQTAADMERPRFYTCVRNATPEQLATTKFAVVKYRQMSRTQRRAVPLQAGEAVAVGESVYIKASRLQHAIGASRGPISAKPSQSANAPGGARRHDPAAHAAKRLDGGIGDQHLRAAIPARCRPIRPQVMGRSIPERSAWATRIAPATSPDPASSSRDRPWDFAAAFCRPKPER